jgi:hypothetical protein
MTMRSVVRGQRGFETAVLLLVLAVTSYQLLIPPLIGIADNGDFVRVLLPVGLERIPTEYFDNYFHYFNSKYRIVPPSDQVSDYKSSVVLLATPARWLNRRIIDAHLFDIRMLAGMYLVLLLTGLGLLLRWTRAVALPWRLLMASLLVLMFTDPPYSAFFNSFYSEAIAIVCLVLICGCALVVTAASERAAWPALTAYFLVAGLLVSGKPSYALFGLLLAPFGVYLAGRTAVVRRYAVASAFAVALLVLSAWSFTLTPAWLKLNANYIGLFTSALARSPTPAEDLRDLGLNPDWVRFVGSTPYDKDSPALDSSFRLEFAERVGSFTVPGYYLRRPARLYATAAGIATTILTTLPHYAGYYEKHTGKPPYAKPLAVWSAIRSRVFPASIWLVLIYCGSGAVAFVLAVRRRCPSRLRDYLLLHAVLAGIAALVFVIPVLTLGTLDTRYSSTFTAAFDLSLIVILGAAAQWRTRSGTGFQ